MSYLLDTNIVIAFMKGNVNVIKALKFQRFHDIYLSSVTLFELYYGAYKSQHTRQSLQNIADLRFQMLDFDHDDSQQAGRIRAQLEAKGKPIGHYDLLLAGQAVNRNLTLITDNIGEFSRINEFHLAELQLENWLRA